MSRKKKFQRVVARLLLLVIGIMMIQVVPLKSRAEPLSMYDELQSNPYYIDGIDLPYTQLQETPAAVPYTISETLTVENAIQQIDEKMGLKGTAAVTEVYSINNAIDNCYYKPALEDVYSLEEYIMSKGFASAYTGYFDLNASAEFTAGQESRALEILGYDFLLADENYDGSNYTANVVAGNVSKQTAIMNIYKALGIEIQEIKLYYSNVDKNKLINSPVVKNLPWLVNDLDASKGRTDVFVTRTLPEAYASKAQTDLHFSSNDVSPNLAITSGEFIVQVMRLMDYYGEAVYSEQEMNALLQVYGAEIPTYLTNIQKEAYMYLRARGVIADTTIDYTQALTLKQMLDILMRVKDTDSRINLKEIQVTVDIGDTMKSAGLFPRTAVVSSNEEAVIIKEEVYTDTINIFDYYVEIPSGGEGTQYVYVPTGNGSVMNDAEYLGITVIGNISYYHMQITATNPNASYFEDTRNQLGTGGTYFVIEYAEGKRIAIESGGGYYRLTGAEQANVAMTNRAAFTNEAEGYCVEMVTSVTTTKNSIQPKSMLTAIKSLFSPLVVKADDDDETLVRLTIYNVSTTNLINQEGSLQSENFTAVQQFGLYDASKDSLVVVLPAESIQSFKSQIERTWEQETLNPEVTIITDVTGENCYVEYTDMVEKGVINDTLGVLGGNTGDDYEILKLDTMNGRVLLNNKAKCVVAGSVMYRVPSSQNLFYTTQDANGNGLLYIDFRAVYGWANNIIYTEVTGDGGTYQVNVATTDSENSMAKVFEETIKKRYVKLPETFEDRDAFLQNGLILSAGMANDYNLFLMVSNYPLANWIVYEGSNGDALYVFYIAEQFEHLGLSDFKPDAADKSVMASEAAPYNIMDNWLVRRFPLSRSSNNEPGQMTYVEDYGYCYIMPDETTFSIESYLKGELLLPLYLRTYSHATMVYNANVNYFEGLQYGSRPAYKGGPSSNTRIYQIDYKGNVSATDIFDYKFPMKAVPAGVQSMFGGVELSSEEWKANGNSQVFKRVSENSSSNDTAMYFGTARLFLEAVGNNDSYNVTFEFKDFDKDNETYVTAIGSGNSDSTRIKLNKVNLTEGTEFYEVSSWRNVYAGVSRYSAVYIATCSDMVSVTAEELSEKELVDPIEILDSVMEDRYRSFEDFSLKYLLDKLDESSSWVFVFCLKILPLVAISALTLIIGFTFLADNKLMQKIVSKTFDPVKLLTFGRKTFQTLSMRNALLTLIIGYLAFAIIVDGNIIRIICFISEIWSAFVELLRNV